MITKTTMVVIFYLQNSHLLTLSLPTEEVFSGKKAKIGLWQIFQLLILILSREKYWHQSHRICNFRFFFKYIGFLPLLRKFEPQSVSDTDFFRVLAAIIRESSDKKLVLRIVKAFPFIHQPERLAPKASDVSAADWLYQHTWKNTIFFHVCCYGFSQSRKSLYNTAVYVIN